MYSKKKSFALLLSTVTMFNGNCLGQKKQHSTPLPKTSHSTTPSQAVSGANVPPLNSSISHGVSPNGKTNSQPEPPSSALLEQTLEEILKEAREKHKALYTDIQNFKEWVRYLKGPLPKEEAKKEGEKKEQTEIERKKREWGAEQTESHIQQIFPAYLKVQKGYQEVLIACNRLLYSPSEKIKSVVEPLCKDKKKEEQLKQEAQAAWNKEKEASEKDKNKPQPAPHGSFQLEPFLKADIEKRAKAIKEEIGKSCIQEAKGYMFNDKGLPTGQVQDKVVKIMGKEGTLWFSNTESYAKSHTRVAQLENRNKANELHQSDIMEKVRVFFLGVDDLSKLDDAACASLGRGLIECAYANNPSLSQKINSSLQADVYGILKMLRDTAFFIKNPQYDDTAALLAVGFALYKYKRLALSKQGNEINAARQALHMGNSLDGLKNQFSKDNATATANQFPSGIKELENTAPDEFACKKLLVYAALRKAAALNSADTGKAGDLRALANGGANVIIEQDGTGVSFDDFVKKIVKQP